MYHKHHATYDDLILSADQGCSMCRGIRQEIASSKWTSVWENSDEGVWYRVNLNPSELLFSPSKNGAFWADIEFGFYILDGMSYPCDQRGNSQPS
jgi:hypothetical protein